MAAVRVGGMTRAVRVPQATDSGKFFNVANPLGFATFFMGGAIRISLIVRGNGV